MATVQQVENDSFEARFFRAPRPCRSTSALPGADRCMPPLSHATGGTRQTGTVRAQSILRSRRLRPRDPFAIAPFRTLRP